MSFFRRLRDALICVALLVAPFFVLNATIKEPSKTNSVDRTILRLSAPLQYLAANLAHGVSSILEEYVFLVDVKRNNEALLAQTQRLKSENYQLQQLASENHRLRALLGLRDELTAETLSAQVISKEVSPFFRVIRVLLDRGKRDRVFEGMPVISPDGLVGQVRKTWGNYSDVVLTVDRSSAIDVVVERTQARGVLRGTGESHRYLCRIEKVAETDEVKVGDIVHTSGLGNRFPARLVVGRVSSVVRRTSDIYQEVEVTPAVNFSTLQEVLILTSNSRANLLQQEGSDETEEDAPVGTDTPDENVGSSADLPPPVEP